MNNIEKRLKKGEWVVVQDEEGYYCEISPYKNSGNYYHSSNWSDTIEKVKKFSFLSCIRIENFPNYKIIEAYHKTPEERYEVGEEVMYKKDRVISNMAGHYKLENNPFSGEIEHYQLTYPIEEEVEELTMEQVCKDLGRTIKIKK